MASMVEPGATPTRYDFDRVVRIVITAGTLVGLLLLVRYLADVLIPFAIAVLIAYLINPVVEAVEKRIGNRIAATLITVSGCFVVIAALIVIAVPVIGGELAEFGTILSRLREDSAGSPDQRTIAERVDAFIEGQSNETVKAGLERLRETLRKRDLEADAERLALKAAKKVFPGLLDLVGGVVSFLLGLSGLIIVLLYTVFLSIDYARLSGGWRDYLPPRHRARIIGLVTEFSGAMSQYFRGQFLIASCVGICFAIGFSIIGLRMGIVLGLFIGMLNMVPYLQNVGMVPALMLAVLRAVENQSSVFVSIMLVLAVFGVCQLIQDALLTPKIMGRQTGLRPVVMLLAIFIWGKLLGFLGLILAIPLTCIGIAFYRRFVLGQANASAVQADS